MQNTTDVVMRVTEHGEGCSDKISRQSTVPMLGCVSPKGVVVTVMIPTTGPTIASRPKNSVPWTLNNQTEKLGVGYP